MTDAIYSITEHNGAVVIERDSSIIYESPLPGQPRAASGAGSLVLRGGERLLMDARISAAWVLGEFRPSDELQDALEELADNVSMLDSDELPLRPDVLVNGQPWGWIRLVDQSFEPSIRWELLPQDFYARASELLSFHASQEGSMTGEVIETRVLWATPVVLWWCFSDTYGMQFMGTFYDGGEDPKSIVGWLFDECADMAFGELEPKCPICDRDDGWSLRINTSAGLEEVWTGSEVARLWIPCDEHKATSDTWTVKELGTVWRWESDTWVRTPEPTPAS